MAEHSTNEGHKIMFKDTFIFECNIETDYWKKPLKSDKKSPVICMVSLYRYIVYGGTFYYWGTQD